jgi:flagellin
MGLRINTNTAALNTQRNIQSTSQDMAKSISRLSSGQKITSAGDDAAGLSISQNLQAQVRSLQQAQRNANDGISLVQTAEGGLNEVSNILVRLRELGVQAASDTVGDTERGFIDKEYQSLKEEVDRLAKVTNFNGRALLSGDGDKISIQVGARAGETDTIAYDLSRNDVRTSALGISGNEVRSRDNALDSLEKIDEAINKVNEFRSNLGATQNRLHSSSNSVGISIENLSEAKSRIADTDIAEETSKLVRNSILQSAGISVLAQANSAPNAALKLL